MESTLRRTWAEINLDAIAYNYRRIREKIGPEVKFLGVVKADAYGHGSIQVGHLLEDIGADYLAVSSADEALELRINGIKMPILILGHTPKEQVARLIEYDITQAITCKAKAVEFSEEAVKCGWSSRQLDRQINSFYYQRILASKDKKSVSEEINELEPKPEYEKIIKDPYVLEFLDLPANEHF